MLIRHSVVTGGAGFNWFKLYKVLERFKNTTGVYVWRAPPHLLIVWRKDFIGVGGYDERFNPIMAETVELEIRLKKMGLKCVNLDPNSIELTHLKTHPNPRHNLNQKHLTWTQSITRCLLQAHIT